MHLDIVIDRESGTPPFAQAMDQIRVAIQSGALPAGTKLPPVRTLAADVGLAANTAARVYKDLEAEGLVVTQGRNGTIVANTEDALRARLRQLTTELVDTARRAGLTLDEAKAHLDDAWR